MRAQPKAHQPTEQHVADAQWAVIGAIYDLDGVYSQVRQRLVSEVYPTWKAVWKPPWGLSWLLPKRESDVSLQAAKDALARQAAEDALKAWARAFRLTSDGTAEGHPLLWILDWGRQVCRLRHRHERVAALRPGARLSMPRTA
jgi:hypothetical protein